MFDIIILGASAFFATIGFAIIIDVPQSALAYCGVTGLMGWFVNWICLRVGMGDTLAIFLGSTVISVLAMRFAQLAKTPTTLFNIPAIFVLVPGIKAYQTVKSFIGGDYILGVELMVKTFTLSVTIAIAIVMAEVLYRLTLRLLKKTVSTK